MTQLQAARDGKITKEMEYVAKQENIDVEKLRSDIANGLVVIPANINHKNLRPVGIGKGLKVKVNANIGTSPVKSDLENELKKLDVAIKAGADTVMDLSTGGDLDATRKTIIENSDVPIGTVPIYQLMKEKERFEAMDIESYIEVIEKQAKLGVDYFTIHAGITRKVFPLIENRMMKVVSRGGSFLLAWMRHYKKENFLFEHFDKILAIMAEHDVTLSLGDGMRPGCINDATDAAQIEELKTLGELARRAREAGVQVMIEGPGHIPLNEIEKNVQLQKDYCDNAPFYVLGPLPTDIAAGYDHIACAIGGALAAWKGADFLCYVTPKEHIGLPDIDDVRDGVVITKIAAHVADIARGNKDSIARDKTMAQARVDVDWETMADASIDKPNFVKLRRQECEKNPNLVDHEYCSMCGPFCVFRIYEEKEES